MRGFVVFLGLLLILGGGAVAGAQYAPVDLSSIPQLDQVPGARDFLTSQMAIYAGGGAAAFGLLLVILALAAGGRKNEVRAPVKSPSMARETIRPTPPPPPRPPAAPPPPPPPLQPAAPAAPQVSPQPAATMTAASEPPKAKPQASAVPPPSALDPSMINRKRVQDLVIINDALKEYHAKHGAYPKANGMAGANERGTEWIPELVPQFLPQLPRDPLHGPTNQYAYASNGTDYKLVVLGASLVGARNNVEVLGIRLDRSRNPTRENAAFGFWTPAFEQV